MINSLGGVVGTRSEVWARGGYYRGSGFVVPARLAGGNRWMLPMDRHLDADLVRHTVAVEAAGNGGTALTAEVPKPVQIRPETPPIAYD